MTCAEITEKASFSSFETPFSAFKDLKPTEYYELVTDGINFNHINDLCRKLEGIDLPEGVLIATCGSDGKLEQHAQSKTELVILEENVALDGDIILRDFFGSDQYCTLFDTGNDGMIDVKSLDSAVPFSYTYQNPDIVYPDWVLTMLPLHPITEETLNLYYKARERVLGEMSTDKRIRSEMKSQLRDYKRAMRAGEHRHVRAFDEAQSLQYYSEKPSQYTLGFKTSFLRSTQRKLDLLTIALNGQKEWGEVAREMPTTTVGRLHYLACTGVIPVEVAAATSEAYAWFLQQYHHIQENYKENGKPTEMPYDSESFEKYSETIKHFASL